MAASRPAGTAELVTCAINRVTLKSGDPYLKGWSAMLSATEVLRAINVEIGSKESKGEAAFFESLLAPAFAIRRANGTVDSRDQCLAKVAVSPERVTEVESVAMFGDCRAVVACNVGMHDESGDRRFHNVRLFVRPSSASSWQ